MIWPSRAGTVTISDRHSLSSSYPPKVEHENVVREVLTLSLRAYRILHDDDWRLRHCKAQACSSQSRSPCATAPSESQDADQCSILSIPSTTPVSPSIPLRRSLQRPYCEFSYLDTVAASPRTASHLRLQVCYVAIVLILRRDDVSPRSSKTAVKHYILVPQSAFRILMGQVCLEPCPFRRRC